MIASQTSKSTQDTRKSVADKSFWEVTLPPLDDIAILTAQFQGKAEGYQYAMGLLQLYNGMKTSYVVVASLVADAIQGATRSRDAQDYKSLQWYQEDSEITVFKELLHIWSTMEQEAEKKAQSRK